MAVRNTKLTTLTEEEFEAKREEIRQQLYGKPTEEFPSPDYDEGYENPANHPNCGDTMPVEEFKTTDIPMDVINERSDERMVSVVRDITVSVPMEKLALIQMALYGILASNEEQLKLNEAQTKAFTHVTSILNPEFTCTNGKALYHSLVEVRKALQTLNGCKTVEVAYVMNTVCEHLSELINTILKGFTGW